MKSILDPTFKYVPSYATDIRRTFAKFAPRIACPNCKQSGNVIQELDPCGTTHHCFACNVDW